MENREGRVKDLVEKLQRGELTHKEAKKILRKGGTDYDKVPKKHQIVLNIKCVLKL